MSDYIIHPFLKNLQEEDLQTSVLWNTNADFPLSRLIEAEGSELKSANMSRILSDPEVVEVEENVIQVQAAEMGVLSPFAQWLLTLKPISMEGSLANTPGSGRPILPEIQSLSLKVQTEKPDKRKKKKKKKKKEARRKAEKPGSALPVLSKDIASDTLAELIAGQGHIEEAIAMYRKLVSLHPDKAAHYLQKIADLRQL